MATAYDKPIDNKLIDTYVPLPFQEMMQHSAQLRDTYDKNLDTLDVGRSTLAAIEAVGPAAKQELAGISTGYEGFAEKMAAGDLTSYDAKRQIKQQVSQLSNDPTLKNIISQTAAIKDAQKRHQAMASDPNYKAYYAQDYSKAMDQYSREGSKSNIDFGNINFLKPVDVREVIEKPIFDQVQADADVMGKGFYEEKNKGIGLAKIFRLADANVGQYLSNRQVQMDLNNTISTPEGAAEVAGRFDINLQELKDKGVITEQQFTEYKNAPIEYKYAQNRLLGSGKERIFNERDLSADQVKLTLAQMAQSRAIAAAKNKDKEQELVNTRSVNAYNTAASFFQKAVDNKKTTNVNLESLGKFKDGKPTSKAAVMANVPKENAEEVYNVSFFKPSADYKKQELVGNHYIQGNKDLGIENVPINNFEIMDIVPRGGMRYGQTADGQYAAQGVSYAIVNQATFDKLIPSLLDKDKVKDGEYVKSVSEKYRANPGTVYSSGRINAEDEVVRNNVKAGEIYIIPITSENIITQAQVEENAKRDIKHLSKLANTAELD